MIQAERVVVRPDEHGMACHSLRVRVGEPPSGETLRQRLIDTSGGWPALCGTHVWESAVRSAIDGHAGRQRVQREAKRPILGRATTHGPSAIRAVLIRGTDAAELVLVARRDRVSRSDLERLADFLLGGVDPGAPTASDDGAAGVVTWPVVDWGLGDIRRAGRIGSVRLCSPCGDTRRLVGAIAIALSIYGASEPRYVGWLDPGGRVVRLRVPDVALNGQEFLDALVATEDSATDAELPAVGVAVTDDVANRKYLPCQTPLFPLTIHGTTSTYGVFDGWCQFDEGAIDPEVAAAFCACVVRVADQLTDHTAAVSEIPPLDAAAEADVLNLGATASVDAPPARIDALIVEVTRDRPDAIALIDEVGRLTYRELDDRSDQVAAGLRALDVTPGMLIGVYLERGTPLVVALLGVLKAGCTYVPMDVRSPTERLRHIVVDAGLGLVLGDPGSFPAVTGVRVVLPNDLPREQAADAPTTAGSPYDPAYLIYTSGSTGRPKGVLVPHRNVVALVAATCGELGLGPNEVWTMFHSCAFDFSVWEIWGCLLTGGRLVVTSHWCARDADAFHELLAAERVTVLSQTPSAFAQLSRVDRSACRDLAVRVVVLGGEPLDIRSLAPWFSRHPHTHCRVVNMFGITETTVHVTAQTITPHEVASGSRSVGRALPGWSVSVRDAVGRVLPPGASGEIYVGGVGLADGYLGLPELTAERFVVDPVTGGRRYRSGDRGRLRPDGRLDHLGRFDNQIKIRGHRIELDEIRSVLVNDLGAIAAVVSVSKPTPDDPASHRIDAYVVLPQGYDSDTLLRGARRFLPDYMMPSTVTEISEIRLTANGKPDIARLPVPLERMENGDQLTNAPADLTGEILQIWSACLGTAVTPSDNFFELGGNSLLVERVLASMRERGLPKVSARDVYLNSTAGQFIDLVSTLRNGTAGRQRLPTAAEG